MFLNVCVILFTEGVSRQGEPPLPGRTPQQGEPPPQQGEPPPGTRHTPSGADPPGPGTPRPGTRHNPLPPGADPPSPGSRRQHTVNERPVRILLEFILVSHIFLTAGAAAQPLSMDGVSVTGTRLPDCSLCEVSVPNHEQQDWTRTLPPGSRLFEETHQM